MLRSVETLPVRTTSRAFSAACILLGFLLSSLSLVGQNSTGSISGTVVDASSAVIPNATAGLIGTFSGKGQQLCGPLTMTLDGANLLDPGNQGTQTANINQNQVQEVSLLTSAYGAEFAKGPVTFQAIGKSGSSSFHGGAYLYARNGVVNSWDSP